MIKLFASMFWIVLFTWNNGFGLNIAWWVYVVAIILWFLYLRFNKASIFILFAIFFLNLHINHLFGISNFKFDFNVDQINITNYKYIETVSQYRLENVYIPYKLRMVLYSSWIMGFYWLDSFFKIISPLLWVRILGFAGYFVACFGIFKTSFKYLLWLIIVCLSSSLALLYDTKTAVILSLPSIIIVLSNGLDNKFIKKYWWLLLILATIDLIQK
ncbi:MAG: hypothetical protein Q7R95_04860 [bacterium]|nr:hypothetical protein [bacterium]